MLERVPECFSLALHTAFASTPQFLAGKTSDLTFHQEKCSYEHICVSTAYKPLWIFCGIFVSIGCHAVASGNPGRLQICEFARRTKAPSGTWKRRGQFKEARERLRP